MIAKEEPTAKRACHADSSTTTVPSPLLAIAPELILAVASYLQFVHCGRLVQTCSVMRALLADSPTFRPPAHAVLWGPTHTRQIASYVQSKARLAALQSLELIHHPFWMYQHQETSAHEIWAQLDPIFQGATDLQTVTIRRCSSNLDLNYIMQSISQCCKSTLHTLKLELLTESRVGELWTYTGRCTNLRRLHLDWKSATDAAAGGVNDVSMRGFWGLTGLSQLEALTFVSGTRAGPEPRTIVHAFLGMHALQKLTFIECPWLTADTADAVLLSCPHLQQLVLCRCPNMTEQDLLVAISRFVELESLVVLENSWFTDRAMWLVYEQAPSSLRSLLVDGCPVSVQMAQMIAHSSGRISVAVGDSVYAP